MLQENGGGVEAASFHHSLIGQHGCSILSDAPTEHSYSKKAK